MTIKQRRLSLVFSDTLLLAGVAVMLLTTDNIVLGEKKDIFVSSLKDYQIETLLNYSGQAHNSWGFLF